MVFKKDDILVCINNADINGSRSPDLILGKLYICQGSVMGSIFSTVRLKNYKPQRGFYSERFKKIEDVQKFLEEHPEELADLL